LQQSPNHHLAQLNIGRIRYEIDDPRSDHAFDWQTASAQLWKTARCAPAEQVA
jgi:hypothetical protein